MSVNSFQFPCILAVFLVTTVVVIETIDSYGTPESAVSTLCVSFILNNTVKGWRLLLPTNIPVVSAVKGYIIKLVL